MTHSEDKMRRYLLGQLDEAEAAEFEESYFGDEGLAADVRVQEDTLLEAYLEGTLETEDQQRLEERLTGSPDLRARLQLIEHLKQLEREHPAAAQSMLERVRAWVLPGPWPLRLLPLAAALLIGVVIFDGPGNDAETLELNLRPTSLRATSSAYAAPPGRALNLRLMLPPDEPSGEFEIVAKREDSEVWRRRVSSSDSAVEFALLEQDANAGLLVLTLHASNGDIVAFYELRFTEDTE
ncbi:MAG: hypothetical protein AAF658_15480 [Myxococcota bacterium]